MLQILLSISQKVRTTSHFWSKLFELAMPSVLVSSALSSSSGNGNNNNSGEGCTYSPTDSPVGTPIGSPVPGSTSNNGTGNTSTSNSLRKLMHSPRSSSSSSSSSGGAGVLLSRTQLERGRLLELCLAVLGCSAQWHLHLLANR